MKKTMKLEEFLRRLDLGVRQFSTYSGIHPNTVLDALNGYEITYKTIEIIIDRTFGLVDFKELKPTKERAKRTKKADNFQVDLDSSTSQPQGGEQNQESAHDDINNDS